MKSPGVLQSEGEKLATEKQDNGKLDVEKPQSKNSDVENLSSDAVQSQRAKTDPGIGPEIQVSVVTSATAMEQVHAEPKASHAPKWWKTKHFVSVLQGMKGGGCSHLFHELQETERAMGDTIPAPEDQLKEQVTVMARHALERMYLIKQFTSSVLLVNSRLPTVIGTFVLNILGILLISSI